MPTVTMAAENIMIVSNSIPTQSMSVGSFGNSDVIIVINLS